METIYKAGTPLPNGMFVDDGDVFGDNENSTESETQQRLSYSEILDELKRQVQQLIEKEVRIEHGQRKRIRNFVEWAVEDGQDISDDFKFQKGHNTIEI